ncbi:MAG: hypothetical protein AAGD05_07110, partial [Bacteroidota bacterium]
VQPYPQLKSAQSTLGEHHHLRQVFEHYYKTLTSTREQPDLSQLDQLIGTLKAYRAGLSLRDTTE